MSADAPSAAVLDVTAATFERDVLEASRTVPVVVDLWAPWCGPCRALGPMLERLAVEYGGRFRLVKINTDENPELAQAFNVRSIPDVRALRDGEEIDRFLGVLPERALRAFLDNIAPPPAEEARRFAAGLRSAGDLAQATAALRKAVALDPAHHLAHIDLADALIAAGQHEAAALELAGVPEDPDWDQRVTALRQAIAFARAGGSEAELAQRVAADPQDLEARLALAGALAARQAWREALDELLEIVRRNKTWRDGVARQQMVAIFSLADDADLVGEYRRKLGSALN